MVVVTGNGDIRGDGDDLSDAGHKTVLGKMEIEGNYYD